MEQESLPFLENEQVYETSGQLRPCEDSCTIDSRLDAYNPWIKGTLYASTAPPEEIPFKDMEEKHVFFQDDFLYEFHENTVLSRIYIRNWRLKELRLKNEEHYLWGFSVSAKGHQHSFFSQ